MKMAFARPLPPLMVFPSISCREKWGWVPEVLSSLYPSFLTSWELGIVPAASVLASRNWHWVHCLQWEAHGCGLKVHSWDQNSVWNTNSLCALVALFPRLPHPHQASRAKWPPLTQVSTCGLSFYSHPHMHRHIHTRTALCHFDDVVQADIWALVEEKLQSPNFSRQTLSPL